MAERSNHGSQVIVFVANLKTGQRVISYGGGAIRQAQDAPASITYAALLLIRSLKTPSF